MRKLWKAAWRFRLVTGFAIVATAAASAAAPGDQAIDLPGDRLFPESVSILPDGTAYIGSMAGGVLRVSLRRGTAEQWIVPGAYGSGALFGVLADSRNGILWTCTNDFPGRPISVAGADPGHWLKGFDLKTGAGKVSLRLPGDASICNDIAVARDGAVYVTDTAQPRILRWRPGAAALEVWLENPALGVEPSGGGIDGIAFGGDGNLYVNNVLSGRLFRVTVGKDGKPGAVTALTPSRPLERLDGMRALGGLDFAVAEGVGRIATLRVAGDTVTVTTLATDIVQPTGVDVFGGKAWYVQGQLSNLFDPADAPPPQLPFRLTPVALKP